jgi:formylglycine-generating enzyme required for sulfatase activity
VVFYGAVVVIALSAAAARADSVNVFQMPDGQTSLAFVPIGDVNNPVDPGAGRRAGAQPQHMGTYDVTVGQYCQFLNAVAQTDTYGLYNSYMSSTNGLYGPHINITQSGTPGNYSYAVGGSYAQAANCPIYAVTWGDAARFCNWLQNGQPKTLGEVSGSTETGAYTLAGANDNNSLVSVGRNDGASYFLPTLDEWYKAAYYNVNKTASGYWAYPTQNDSCPCNCPLGTNNANFYSCGGGNPCTDPVNRLTPVGFFADSPGPYGTYDQGGNVNQWSETSLDGLTRDAFGGDWDHYCSSMDALATSFGSSSLPMTENSMMGFRVAASASVPEPGSISLLLVYAVSLAAYAWRRRAAS